MSGGGGRGGGEGWGGGDQGHRFKGKSGKVGAMHPAAGGRGGWVTVGRGGGVTGGREGTFQGPRGGRDGQSNALRASPMRMIFFFGVIQLPTLNKQVNTDRIGRRDSHDNA